jgi:hypothetical protein
VIASVEQLVAVGLADAQLAAAVSAGDWYLVGSRAIGVDDGLSDWDTLVIRDDPAGGRRLSTAQVDEAFGTVRPALPWPPDLAGHMQWRSAAGVELEVMDPQACVRREQEGLACWAYELAHAVPLRLSTGAGERYRKLIADRFADQLGQLTDAAYRGFRLARNQAAASLPRPDSAAQMLTSALCVTQAARFWLPALGQPHPSDKWLLAALGQAEGGGPLLEAMRAALDPRRGAPARFDALWRLWRLVDERAAQAGIESSALSGSPFVRTG